MGKSAKSTKASAEDLARGGEQLTHDETIAAIRLQWSTAFETMLTDRSRQKNLRKSERTRLKFLAAIARLLQEVPSTSITVDMIIDMVDLARGTFYIYFDGVPDIIKSILVMFSVEVNLAHPFDKFFSSPRQSTYAALLYRCRLFEINQGLFSARALHRDEVLSGLYERVNADAANNILHTRAGGNPMRESDPQRLLGIIRLMISMSDDAMRERFVRQDTLMCRSFERADHLAQGLNHVWSMTLFGEPPRPEDIEYVNEHPLFRP